MNSNQEGPFFLLTFLLPSSQEFQDQQQQQQQQRREAQFASVPVPHAPHSNKPRNQSKKSNIHSGANSNASAILKNGGVAVSMDYWSQYDPEDALESGQSVITTEALPVETICFLCGAAGQEQMLHCNW